MPEAIDMLTDQLVLVQALHNIASESDDAEDIRMAMSALTNTEAGRTYLATNPLNV
jgi:hypothetical protein